MSIEALIQIARRRPPLLPLAGEGKDEGPWLDMSRRNSSARDRLDPETSALTPLTLTLSREREREAETPRLNSRRCGSARP